MRCLLTALFYGDYPQLAKRCVSSWGQWASNLGDLVSVAICVNEIGAETRTYLQDWIRSVWDHGWPGDVYWLEGEKNIGKYPMLRGLLRSEASRTADHLMWFDDDAYLLSPLTEWWPRAKSVFLSQQADLMGKLYYMPMTSGQWKWIREQPWSDPQIQSPLYFRRSPVFRFCQGSWWLIRQSCLQEADFPPLELHHCGGDSLLGEIARHRKWKMLDWSQDVRVNADEQGRNSRSRRRGINQPRLASQYDGTPLSTEHYRDCRIRCLHYAKPA